MLGQVGDAEPPRHDAIGERAERAALQVVVGEVEHDRNGALDGVEVLQDLLGDRARLGEIEERWSAPAWSRTIPATSRATGQISDDCSRVPFSMMA